MIGFWSVRRRGGRATAAAVGVIGVSALAGAAVAPEPPDTAACGAVTSRASVSTDGRQGNSGGGDPALSRHGRYVAFSSDASNLVPGDTNGAFDVFVRDRSAGVTRRASVGPGGRQANGDTFVPAVSAGGRYVAFESDASNLVARDTNRWPDVFVRDQVAGVTRRVSVSHTDRQARGFSEAPAISAGGRYVAFRSSAANLVAGDTNRAIDIFVRDRVDRVTRRVSIATGGRQANGSSFGATISGDGRFVAFSSDASNLVRGDSNRDVDVFVRDRMSGATRRVSVGPNGRQANNGNYFAVMSADGRYVAFHSFASNLVAGDTNGELDVFVRNRSAGVTRRVSVGRNARQANSRSDAPSISADGRYISFDSFASNLVAGDTNTTIDVFVRDRKTGVTRRVSVGLGGRQANTESFDTTISADGRHVAFGSNASNLVAGDTNRVPDVFVRGPLGRCRPKQWP